MNNDSGGDPGACTRFELLLYDPVLRGYGDGLSNIFITRYENWARQEIILWPAGAPTVPKNYKVEP